MPSRACTVVFCGLLLALQQLSAGPGTAEPSIQRGQGLFTGGVALRGRPIDHTGWMPPEAVVCSHCHATSSARGSSNFDAPVLNAASLTGFKSRRNGPQSRFDQPSFCKLLRTNVDPVYIRTSKLMPIFEINDADCQSLWLYLTAKS